MANNFRIAGNYYVSKGGHDSNDGLTPDTPKKTIPGGSTLSREEVYGAGVYFVNIANKVVRSATGDGRVIIDFQGNSPQSFIHVNDSFGFFKNIHFKNSASISLTSNS